MADDGCTRLEPNYENKCIQNHGGGVSLDGTGSRRRVCGVRNHFGNRRRHAQSVHPTGGRANGISDAGDIVGGDAGGMDMGVDRWNPVAGGMAGVCRGRDQFAAHDGFRCRHGFAGIILYCQRLFEMEADALSRALTTKNFPLYE